MMVEVPVNESKGAYCLRMLRNNVATLMDEQVVDDSYYLFTIQIGNETIQLKANPRTAEKIRKAPDEESEHEDPEEDEQAESG